MFLGRKRWEGDDLRFAVTAPGGVEFEEDVVFVVYNDVFVVVGHDHLNGTFLFFGNGL